MSHWRERLGLRYARRHKRLIDYFEAERDRWLLWVPVLMALGIGFYFSLEQEPGLWPLWLLVVLVGLLVLLENRNGSPGYWPIVLRIAVCISLGVTVAKLRTELVDAPVILKEMRAVSIEGRIVRILPGSDGFPRLVIEPSAMSRLSEDDYPKYLRLSYRGKTGPIYPGANIRFRASLMPPPTPAIPHGFDFARQSFFDRIGGVGYIISKAEAMPLTESLTPGEQIKGWIAKARAGLSARLKAAMPGNRGAIAAALIVGDRSGIPPDKVDDLRDAGLAHLLAISGLHMGMAGWAIFALVRGLLAAVPFVALHYPIKKWAAIAGLIGASAYLLLSGAPISAQRAYLMLSLVFVAILLDRPAFTLRMVALAATIILFFQPESLLEAGFQMSFAACTVLVSGYEARRRWIAGRRQAGGFVFGAGAPTGLFHWFWAKGARYVGGILLTSLLAGFATAPFSAFHFNHFANYGLAGNLFAVPVMGVFVMPWAVLGLVLMPFGLEALPLGVMGFGIEQVLLIAERVADQPYSVTAIPSGTVPGLVLLVLGGLWLLLWSKKWRLAGVAGMVGGLVVFALAEPPDVIIGRDGKNLAVRTPEGALDIMKNSRRNYAVQTWERRAGLGQEDERPKEEAAPFECDKLGCVYKLADGRTLIHVNDGRALPEDCRVADIIITHLWVPKTCDGPGLIIDKMDIRDGGAHLVRLLEEGYQVTTSRDVRGNRPWSQGS